jgi:hypothetical protein
MDRVFSVIRAVVESVVARDARGAAEKTGGARLPAAEIDDALSIVDEPLAMPADSLLRGLAEQCATQWSSGSLSCAIEIDLLTDAGTTDLTLELTVLLEGGRPRVEIDNLHVL